MLALDPATGKLKWHYQFTPHDLHDWDATETPVLVDANFHGQPRKLLLQANRNGFFYVLDRAHRQGAAGQAVRQEADLGQRHRPRRPPHAARRATSRRRKANWSVPAVAGAANWPSNAYSPVTGLFYMFAEESCNIYSKNDQWWEAGKSFYGGADAPRARRDPAGKLLRAIDIQTGKIAWEIPDVGGGILGSGLMATAGGLIFYGDAQRRVRGRRRPATASCSGTSTPARAGRLVR